MYRIAMIGAGQLSRRHLQRSIPLNLDGGFFAMDFPLVFLRPAQNGVNGMGAPWIAERVKYLISRRELSGRIDGAVAVTAVDVCLSMPQILPFSRSVRNLFNGVRNLRLSTALRFN